MTEESDGLPEFSGIINDIYCAAEVFVPKYFDIYRVGKISDKPRPIKVELTCSGDVQLILKKSYKLRESEDYPNYRSVYLAPDRSKEENEMKELIKLDSSKHYFIRNNKVNCVDKKWLL